LALSPGFLWEKAAATFEALLGTRQGLATEEEEMERASLRTWGVVLDMSILLYEDSANFQKSNTEMAWEDDGR
jgi:hypothetical protein